MEKYHRYARTLFGIDSIQKSNKFSKSSFSLSDLKLSLLLQKFTSLLSPSTILNLSSIPCKDYFSYKFQRRIRVISSHNSHQKYSFLSTRLKNPTNCKSSIHRFRELVSLFLLLINFITTDLEI